MTTLLAGLLGLLAAWALTVPLHRFKEFRPLGRRDLTDEAGLDIRAVRRHARYARSTHDVKGTDVVPVLSWLLPGRAGATRAPASVLAIQVGIPLAVALTALRFDSVALVVAYGWFCVMAVAVAVTDARILLIPWWMPWVGAAGAAVLLPLATAVGDLPAERVLWAAGSAAGAFGFFFVLFVAAPGKLGFSDVRLMVPIGAFVGFISPLLVLWALMIGSVLGIVGGIASRAATGERHFAFGPALCGGALVAIWLSEQLVG